MVVGQDGYKDTILGIWNRRNLGVFPLDGSNNQHINLVTTLIQDITMPLVKVLLALRNGSRKSRPP